MTAHTTFDYAGFADRVAAEAADYNQRLPYPYAVFDGLFAEPLLDQVSREIDSGEFARDKRSIDRIEVKTRSDFEDNEDVPEAVGRAFSVLNGGKFLDLVSQLTGISGLISDPYYDGGGINIIQNDGTLAVHVDGTHQRRMNVCRRLNAILFLNQDWQLDWNGCHEQWQYLRADLSPQDAKQEWRCVRRILPVRNRLVIFTTNDHSWHGHAGKLTAPAGAERRSLIAYYYTVERPESDIRFESPHSALFIDNANTLRGDPYRDCEDVS